MTIIDTHCHLDFPAFDEDRDQVFDRARAAGVDGFILIGIRPESWRTTENIANERDDVWRAAGVHPNSVAGLWDDTLCNLLHAEVDAGEVVGVGETGIDLFRSSDALDIQAEAFRSHIDLAKAADLPIIIHQRDAEQEVLDVLRDAGGARGVLHCFSGDWAFASACLELGLTLGIGGVATFKRSEATRDAIRRAPADRLIVETDAPFLAPQSRRGKRNEPAYLPEVVEVIAEARGERPSTVAAQTTENARALFRLPARERVADATS